MRFGGYKVAKLELRRKIAFPSWSLGTRLKAGCATLSRPTALPQPKASVCIRLDQEVLDWFKAQGKGYQTRINALLRAYMEAHSKG